jgi:hypothetical protein
MKTLRTVMWQGLAAPSLERFILSKSEATYELNGLILRASGGVPHVLRYSIRTDQQWATLSAEFEVSNGSHRRLSLSRVPGGWRCNGEEQPDLDRCLDVDVEWSPSTNTLPIRRLNLTPGQRQAVTAAWIRLPSLTVQPLEQSYERLDAHTYRYHAGDFVANLEVDGDGVVLNYEGGWRLVTAQGS